MWKIIIVSLLFTFSFGKVSHVVVLMMENRSFDHLLGWLREDYSPRYECSCVCEFGAKMALK